MAQTCILRHERVDDVPFIIGLANRLRLAEVLPHHMGTHGLQQGLYNGQLVVGWLAYILSRADHRTSAVRDWANNMPHTLAQLLGHPIREVECSDDRLGGVLHRLSDDEVWDAIGGPPVPVAGRTALPRGLVAGTGLPSRQRPPSRP